MAGIPLRDIFPKGLYARSVLLTLLPVAIILGLMILYFYYGHLRSMNEKLSQAVAREIEMIDQACRSAPGNLSVIAFVGATLGLEVECDMADPAAWPDRSTERFFYAALVGDTISARLQRPVTVSLDRRTDRLDVRFRASEATRRVMFDRKRAIAINGHIFIVWVVAFSLIMVFTALGFLRNQVRSILRLTEAAQAFGRGQDFGDYRPTGAREIRAAALAVMQMRQRLVRFAEQRTRMLAGISHDLRTPLTRLGLHFAMQEQTEDVKAAREDLAQMKAMLDEYLTFARGEETENSQAVPVMDMLREIVGLYPPHKVRLVSAPEMTLNARPVALKRALSNLVANAAAYAPSAEVSALEDGDMIVVRVDDTGPGIPAHLHEEAMRPFSRLEEARTQNVPGTGLGLALARDTARRAGGRLTLHPSPLGGLRAEMRLPR